MYREHSTGKPSTTLNDLESYNYNLPEELIAQYPTDKRDQSKLLVFSKENCVLHTAFSRIAEQIPKNSLLVLNNSSVFSSRLIGKTETGGKVEIFLLEKPNQQSSAKILAKPMKKLKIGKIIEFDRDLQGSITSIDSDILYPSAAIEFNRDSCFVQDWLSKNALTPLPPYINRKSADFDKNRYQNVYAQIEGSVAAPTSGLHFTEEILSELKNKKNIEIETITLHIGAGTFLPIKSSCINDHKMHSESFAVPSRTLSKLYKYQKEGKPIILCGTTVLRCLEGLRHIALSSNAAPNDLVDRWLSTNIFIHPVSRTKVYKPWFGDAIISNFHQPKSTLILLMSSLIGTNNLKEIYAEAIKNKYRFLSYGDSGLYWLPKG